MNMKTLKSGMVVALLSLSVPASSHAIVILDDKPESLYLDLATSPFLAPVGKLTTTHNGASYISTAVLVSSQWILAAAHTVARGGETLQALEFTLGGVSHFGSVGSVALFPGFNPNLDPSGNYGVDLALFQLTQPITGVAPAKIANGMPVEGTLSVFGGYGRRGNGITGDTLPAGSFLAAQNDIDLIDTVSNTFFTDFDNPPGTANVIGSPFPLPLEGGAAPGDSGAPFFVQYENGEWGVVGILSGIGNLDSEPTMTYGDFTIGTGVTGATGWMTSQGADIAVVPEPTVSALVILGGAVVVGAGWVRRGRGERH